MKNVWLRSIGLGIGIGLTALLGTSVAAQTYDPDGHQKGFDVLTQSGKALNLLIQPAGQLVRLEVVGKDAASVRKVDETVIEASYGLGKERKKITISKLRDPKTNKEYYVFERNQDPLENLEFKVRAGSAQEKFSVPKIP